MRLEKTCSPSWLQRLTVAAALVLLTSCGTFSNKEISVDPASKKDVRNYFRSELFNSDGVSFDTVNFLHGNLLRTESLDDLPVALKKLKDYFSITGNVKYLYIAADLCNGVAKYCSDPEKAIRCQLATLYYCHRIIRTPRKESLSHFDASVIQSLLLYNESCNGVFSYLKSHDLLHCDSVTLLDIEDRRYILQKGQFHSSFPEEAFEDFAAAADFSVKNLRMQTRSFGFGVPLVGYIRDRQIYKSLRTPPGMAAPMTFFLMLSPRGENEFSLHPVYQDTLMEEAIMPPAGINAELFNKTPLALDFSTPLAVFLDNLPERNLIGTMLNADEENYGGLYMVEPFNPDKIPVVFVHGLMSSPGTWLQMINTLKNDPVIRRNYQFWFFAYSSGMPVFASARKLREPLMEAYKEFAVDEKTRANFEKTVIVGHSMGGLITRSLLQKEPSYLIEQVTGEAWEKLSEPWSPEEKAEAEKIMFFPAVPFVHRAVFIATPHRGSLMARMSIAKLGIALIKLPISILDMSADIVKLLARHGQTNAGIERMKEHAATGIDNLDPANPFIVALGSSPMKDDLVYHSIIGNEKAADQPGGSDGVVAYSSSHLDGAASEWIVHSGHSAHRDPGAIRELQRILLLHLQGNDKK
ncbi:MAG: hypothetical protein MJ016_00435 [Victivallaceae bacterium]|nr:hypothetical protein [Victivallaceae bacterium]